MKCPYDDCDRDVALAMMDYPGGGFSGYWCPVHQMVDGQMLDQIKRAGGKKECFKQPPLHHPHGRAEEEPEVSDSAKPCQ